MIDTRYEISKFLENFVWWIARHMPRSIRYWAVIVSAVEVEAHSDPSGVTAIEMLKKIKGDEA